MNETNKLSDGFLPTWRTCPYCGSEDTQAMISLVNAGYLVGMILALVALFVLAWLLGDAGDGSPFAFKRICRKCRGKFWPKPKHETAINCGQCGYDLTGNASGICPECGWTIPPEVRQKMIQSTPTQQHEMRDRPTDSGQPA